MAIYGHSLPMLVLDGPHCSHSPQDSCSHLQRPGGHCFTTNSLSRNSPTENVSRTFTTPLKVLRFWEVAPALLMPLQQCSCAEQQKSIFFFILVCFKKKSHTASLHTRKTPWAPVSLTTSAPCKASTRLCRARAQVQSHIPASGRL